MFPLVPNIFLLKAKEKGEPVEEVHVRQPLSERGLPEVTNGTNSSRCGAYLREPERRVIGEEIVHRDDVVNFIFRQLTGPALSGSRRVTLAKTHSIRSREKESEKEEEEETMNGS